ncbi:alpha/beta fold hydrolase [Actinokineospora iranica]|uniref:alpha/beta fold hydrolase n=1 Tax=Actinokineospora iranica TaxID=1271860 RepID=UPI001E4B12A7|nr:alpha/beta hydrolase [Actinokineospora iranica]
MIAYECLGSGPALVLVGGAFSDRDSARPLAGLLASGFSVHIYDRRGRGGSGDTPPYAVEREIEDLAAVIAAAGSASVFGMSSGGILSLRAAAHGVSMTRIAVYEPPFSATASVPAGFAAEQRARIAEGRREEAVEAFLAALDMSPEVIAAIRDGLGWGHLVGLAHTLPYEAAIVGTGAVPDLSGVSAPVLVVDGAASPASMRAAARAVADALPDASAVGLPGQTHNVDVGVLAPVLRDFFA